jgi:antitoxin component of RelBE/YafQ-DinJ toxin-antitoxin module
MNTTLHVSIDIKTKEAAANLADELGLDLSTIVKASLKHFVMTKRFEVEKSYRMTSYLEQVVGQARKDFAARKNISGPFSTPNEIGKHLSKLMKKK